MSASNLLPPIALAALVVACNPDCPDGATDRHGYRCTPIPGESTSDPSTTSSDVSTSSSDSSSSAVDTSSSTDVSSSTGAPPLCNDNGECDPDEDVSNCPADCNVCGDNVVVPPETCDNGINDDPEYSPTPPDPDACTAQCVSPGFCGDSTQNGDEPCDSAATQTADCEADCSLPSCGDGTLNPLAGESCDDNNLNPGDGCSPDCIEERRVFASSISYFGDFSSDPPLPNPEMLAGIPLADYRCNTLATAAGLPPTFKAWLSDSESSPSTRFDTSFTGLYILPIAPDFPAIANGWTDLTDGTLAHPINTNESGIEILGNVATNTTPEGDSASPVQHCTNWTSNDDTATTTGKSSASDSTWTNAFNDQHCSNNYRLYCFEDP